MRTNFSIARKAKIRSDIKEHEQRCAKQMLLEKNRGKTNADRIRAMNDDELAWELMTWRIETEAKHQGIESNYPNTQATILEWLKQPVGKKL